MKVPTKFDLSTNSKAANDCLWLLARLTQDFPGLLDTETEVNGSDLVDFLTYQIQELDGLKAFVEPFYIEPED